MGLPGRPHSLPLGQGRLLVGWRAEAGRSGRAVQAGGMAGEKAEEREGADLGVEGSGYLGHAWGGFVSSLGWAGLRPWEWAERRSILFFGGLGVQ